MEGKKCSFLEKSAIFLFISLLTKGSAEILPFPPLEKWGRRGDLRRLFQKAKRMGKFLMFL
jgi:hypothetical protein